MREITDFKDFKLSIWPIISKSSKDSWNADNNKLFAEFRNFERAICIATEIISVKLQNVLYMNKT